MSAYDNSKEVVSLLNDMMSSLDEFASEMKDNHYLVLVNNLKKIHDNLTKTKVIELHYRIVERGPTLKRHMLSRAEKMKDERYRLCSRCDCYITKDHYTRHQKTERCSTIFLKKKTSSQCSSTVLNQDDLLKQDLEKS